MSRSVILVLVAALVLALHAPGGVLAQSDDVAVDGVTAPAGNEAGRGSESFGAAFFRSMKTDPSSGEQRLEILGSVIIWFLLALSVLSIGLIGYMALTNQRKSILPGGVVDEARTLLSDGKYADVLNLTRNEPSYFSAVLHAALREANHGFTAMIRSLQQTADELTTNRLRRIEYLNVLGQVSPMIGLFGTVYGMILAFQSIVAAGGNADPVLLAGGIGTALTTTFWGLVVAIPALAGYAIVRNQIDAMTAEATLAAEELLNQFRPRPRGAATPAKSG